MENPKGSPKEPKVRSKVSKGSSNGGTLRTGISDLEKLEIRNKARKIRNQFKQNSFASLRRRGFTRHGVLMNGMMTGVVLDCMTIVDGCVAQPQVHFHLNSDRVNENLDTGVTVDLFLVNFDRERVGDRSFHGWIPKGEARQFEGYDEKGLLKLFEWATHGCTSSVGQPMRQHLKQHRQPLMFTMYGAVLPKSRTQNNKIFSSGMMGIT